MLVSLSTLWCLQWSVMQYVLIRPGTSLSLSLIYAHPMYIEEPSLLLGSFVNITMCYVRLGPIALAIQRYV